jgi:hypothetical protein
MWETCIRNSGSEYSRLRVTTATCAGWNCLFEGIRVDAGLLLAAGFKIRLMQIDVDFQRVAGALT